VALLGSFSLGSNVVARVRWTLDPSSSALTSSAVTLVHKDGTTLGPAGGIGDGAADAYRATVTPSKAGRWYVRWVTTPTGGSTNDSIYVQ
jgi:hypothetical protein